MGGKSKVRRWALILWGIAIAIFVGIWALPDRKPTPEEVAAAASAEAACRPDLTCWAKKNHTAASIECLGAIDRVAGKTAQWDDGTDLKVRYWRWLDREKGTLTYYGDALRLPGQDGQMVRWRFECDFDPGTGKLTGFRLAPAAT